MNHTGKLLLASLLGLGSLLAACGDDETDGAGGSSSSSSTSTTTTTTTTTTTSSSSSSSSGSGGAGGGIPAVPELGEQVDRMGRPAINTATIDTFINLDGSGGGDPVVVPGDNAVRGASQDAYNADANEAQWVATYADAMALQLGVLDSLDTDCENQLLSCGDDQDATDCYGTLSGVLADDRLWVRVDGTDCSATAGVYLAVEADATNTIDNTDCGGRRPNDDVIQTTYSAVALGGVTGFDDGITAPNGLHPDTFPYLATPHIN